MSSADDSNRAARALRFLQSRELFFEYDVQEKVVHVAVYHATGADEIAEHVGQLLDLQTLTFESTDLTDEGLRHLKNLTNIEVLWLTSPKLSGTGLLSLVGMTKMKELILEMPLDGCGLEYIGRLHSLRELCITGGTFQDEDIAPLAALGSLEKLSFPDNASIDGTCAAHLSGLTWLRKFSPGKRITDEGLKCIAQVTQLEDLSVEGDVTDAGLLELASLTELKSLEVKSRFVTSEGIAIVAQLPALNSLSLETPLLADDGIPSLLLCAELEELHVWSAAITDSGIEKLRDLLPKCSVADMMRDWPRTEEQIEEVDERPRMDENVPFATLLTEARDFDLVNGVFSKISDRYGHWVDALQYSPEERVVMLVWHSAALIGNGGFEYLFAGEFDGDSDYHLTAEAYRTAGLDRSYEAFKAAFNMFPGGSVPSDPEERTTLYELANKSAREGINRKLWSESRAHERKLAEFIRKHAAQFGSLENT